MESKLRANRNFMKGYQVVDFSDPQNDFNSSDQQKGITHPPLQKEYDPHSAKTLLLPDFDETILKETNLNTLIKHRRSRRSYTPDPLTLEELSYLLWATQGVIRVYKEGIWSVRTVPSAGARHPFETYLVVHDIQNLEKGVYRYLPLTHELLFLFNRLTLQEEMCRATYNEKFIANSPVVFVWVCIPYRSEWRYKSGAHKSMLLDAGHICQNLYLAAEAIQCGTCAIAGYYQQGMDELLGIDGEDEFTVYLAPVGRIKHD